MDLSPETFLNLADFPFENSTENSPQRLEGQWVQIRGFWYPLSSSEGVLAPCPDLKSCCLKAHSKLLTQISVKGSLDSLPAQRALTLEGVFKVEPLYNSEGQLTQLFVLEQAREIQRESSNFSLSILGILLVLCCICYTLFKWIKQNSSH